MMIYIGLFIAIIFIALVVRLLLKDFFPQAVLLVAGIGMLLVAGFLKKGIPSAEVSSGVIVLDIFE